MLHVVSSCFNCVHCRLLWSVSSCLDRFNLLQIVLCCQIFLRCVYVVHVASGFSGVEVGSGCLGSYVYLWLLNLFTLHYIVIGCFRSFSSVVGNVQVVPNVLGQPFRLFFQLFFQLYLSSSMFF